MTSKREYWIRLKNGSQDFSEWFLDQSLRLLHYWLIARRSCHVGSPKSLVSEEMTTNVRIFLLIFCKVVIELWKIMILDWPLDKLLGEISSWVLLGCTKQNK